MFYDRKVLKNRARESLRRVRPRPWKVTLLYWLLVALIPGAITLVLELVGSSGFFAYLQAAMADPVGWSARLDAMSPAEVLEYYSSLFAPAVGVGVIATFVTTLLHLFQLVMSYGYANYSLKLYRGEATETGNIFSGFPVAGQAIGAGIVTYIFEFLWTLLAVALGVCATLILVVSMVAIGSSTAEIVAGILLVVVWVAVVLFSIFISYRYSLVPYFILTTDMGVMEAVRASREHMRGNLGRRFMLELSFIGWELVNALIAIVVALVGYFILVVALSVFTVFQAMELDPYYVESDAYMNQMVGQVLSQMLIGIGVLAVVTEAATLPIGLWLTAYRGSAYAGFFLTLTGQDDQPQVIQRPVTDYIPPQPSNIWDQVPPPPSFTGSTAPVEEGPAAQAPSEPEASAMPEVPAADMPVEAVAEAPVEEVTGSLGEAEVSGEPEALPAEPGEGPGTEPETEE